MKEQLAKAKDGCRGIRWVRVQGSLVTGTKDAHGCDSDKPGPSGEDADQLGPVGCIQRVFHLALLRGGQNECRQERRGRSGLPE